MKDAYYFAHDSNARHDESILAMRSVYGTEGYGRYWIIIEMLRDSDTFRLQRNKYIGDALAMQMQCTKDEAATFLVDCIEEFHLFDSDGNQFWSNSLLRRMERYEATSEKRRQAAQARWSKRDANALQTECKSNALKERKGKEKKGKESSIRAHPLFDQFWQVYPNKKSKNEAIKAFAKINPDEQLLALIVAKIEQAKTSEQWRDQAGRYIPYPATWLNQRRWEDEYGEAQRSTAPGRLKASIGAPSRQT